MINNVKVTYPAKVKKVRISEIRENLEFLIQNNCYSVVNNLLHKLYVNMPTFDTNKIVVYVKLANPIKEHLPIWKTFATSAELELKKRKVDTTGLFV
jgi:hypothetical protein